MWPICIGTHRHDEHRAVATEPRGARRHDTGHSRKHYRIRHVQWSLYWVEGTGHAEASTEFKPAEHNTSPG